MKTNLMECAVYEKDTDVDQQNNATIEVESEEGHDVSPLAPHSEASQFDQHSHVVAPEKPGKDEDEKTKYHCKTTLSPTKEKISDSESSDLPSRVPDGHGTDTQPPPLSPRAPEKPGVEGGADDQLSEPPKDLGCEKETVESPALLDRQGEDPQSDPHSPTAPKNLEKDTDVDQQINPTEELESEEGHDVSPLAPHSEASQSDQHSHVAAPEKPGRVQRQKNKFEPKGKDEDEKTKSHCKPPLSPTKGKVSDSEPSDLPSRVPDGHGTDTQPPPLSPRAPEKPGVEGGADDQLSEPPKDLGCEKETVESPALLDRQSEDPQSDPHSPTAPKNLEKDTDVDQQINPTEELESEEGHDVSPLAPHSEASQSDQHSHVAAPEKPGRVQRQKNKFEPKGKDEDEKTKSHCKPPLSPTKGKVSDSEPSDLPSRVPDGHGTDTQPPPLSPRAPEKPGVEGGADDQLSEPPKDLGCEKETVESPALLDRQSEDPQSDPHSPTAPKNLEKDTDVDQQINPTEELESEEGHDVSPLAPHSEASQSDQHSHVAAPEKPGWVQRRKNIFEPKGTQPPPLSPRTPEKPGVEGGADDQLSEPPKDLGCEKETVESPALLDRQSEDPQSDPHSPTAPKNLEKDTDVDQQINPTEELESEEGHDVSPLAPHSEASQSDQHSHVAAPEKPGWVQRRKNIFEPKGTQPPPLSPRTPEKPGVEGGADDQLSEPPKDLGCEKETVESPALLDRQGKDPQSDPHSPTAPKNLEKDTDVDQQINPTEELESEEGHDVSPLAPHSEASQSDQHSHVAAPEKPGWVQRRKNIFEPKGTQPPPLSPRTPEKPGVEGGADDQLSEPPKDLGCEKETVESPALLDRQGEDPQSDPHSPTAPKNLEKDTDVDQQINPTEELESEEGHDVSPLAPHSEASQSDQHSHVAAPEKPGWVQRRKNIFEPKGTQPPPLSPRTPEKPGVEGGADDQLSEPPKDLGCEKETVESPALLDRQSEDPQSDPHSPTAPKNLEKDTDVDQQINPTEELESEEGHDVSPLAPHSEASQSDQHSHVAAPEKPGWVQRRKNIFEPKGTQPPPLSPRTPEKPDTPTNEESSPAPAAPSCPPGVQTPEKVSPEDSGAQQSDDNSVDVSEETKTETPGLKEGNESDD
ncbi:uncharacterized protein KZ484_014911 [Pholidichthys leucotaenia]